MPTSDVSLLRHSSGLLKPSHRSRPPLVLPRWFRHPPVSWADFVLFAVYTPKTTSAVGPLESQGQGLDILRSHDFPTEVM